MDYKELVEFQWPYLLSFLDAEEPLEVSAKRLGAMTRKRRVDSAEKLLRLSLAYGFCGLSLRQTAAWAESAGIASLSDVALLNRFKKASGWLGHLVATKLASRSGSRPRCPLQLMLVDASTINAPGNTSTDWRLHLGFDLASFMISDVKLTDYRGGESLKRYSVAPGDVVVGDRGYSRRGDLISVTQRQADFIVRLNWACIPLAHRDGSAFDLLGELRKIPDASPAEFPLAMKPDPKRNLPALPVRVIAIRKSEAAADDARRKLVVQASKKQKNLDPRALEMAAYVLVITSTSGDRLTPADILEIYRFRWQIELVFKRLKSLLDLDGLPAKDPDLARTFIFSKILAALLLDDFTQAFVSFSPWGFNIE